MPHIDWPTAWRLAGALVPLFAAGFRKLFPSAREQFVARPLLVIVIVERERIERRPPRN